MRKEKPYISFYWPIGGELCRDQEDTSSISSQFHLENKISAKERSTMSSFKEAKSKRILGDKEQNLYSFERREHPNPIDWLSNGSFTLEH